MHAETTPAVGPEYAELAAFFDRFEAEEGRWRRQNRAYHDWIARLHRFQIPSGARVLEIGCGSGGLLASLEPSVGVGIDVSERMVELARSRHPDLRFEHVAGERLELGETFDYIVLSDVLPFVHDLVALFDRIAEHSHPGTRVVIHSYSRLWRPAIRLAEALGQKPRKPIRNWIAPEVIKNMLQLSDFEVVTESRRMLLPKRVPGLNLALNGVVGSIWPFNHLCLTYWVVARPRTQPREELSASIVCPCRNERGNVASVIERLPELGPATELVFVEGGSRDGTREEIERQIASHPGEDLRFVPQPGKGKGDAVRAGFEAARHDVLGILDGDLSVRPEDLPKFHRALSEGRGDLVNGTRLVYDIEPGAMRFLNLLGNKIFRFLIKGITGQLVTDTLCGTKVLRRADYERIAAGRAYFGDFDPFGDFDLLLGAARLNLKIVDMPVRYQPRTYGETNISRWRHGWLLLRMTVFAFWKFRVEPFRGKPSAG
jgi:2-polyprenyl-3-methyl-5-hydroxy-6-metoxy-1,4-benzoquinol methylase